ncbi:MAG TPA: hypothetical protein VFM18_07940 [Methanosarcina sp.]|nr:hypothetical protein [Methanosarcina sp.]
MIAILSKELSLHSCPKQEYGWRARGGCHRLCDKRYHQPVAVDCWEKWANEQRIHCKGSRS